MSLEGVSFLKPIEERFKLFGSFYNQKKAFETVCWFLILIKLEEMRSSVVRRL